MSRPLYKVAVDEPRVRPPEGHAGLWFDKFCNTWRVNGNAWEMKGKDENNPKLAWINSVTKGQLGEPHQLEEYVLRLARLVEKQGGRTILFKTESRFVTGLGRSHAIENGFAWHPTLGTPYLPGSSVKGMVRAWAEQEATPSPKKKTLERLLGKRDSVGSLSFLDAVPAAPVQLEADVMTPHYAGWSAKEPPGDWMSPTPIPFLATAARTSFLFGIVPHRAVAEDDLATVADWLREALAWAGAGAKTSVGYGRFRRDDEGTRGLKQQLSDEDRRRREQRKREEAVKSPEGRWRLKIEGKTEAEVLDLVRVHLEKERLADPVERRAFANAVLSIFSNWVEGWRRGRKQDPRTNVGTKKLKARARLLCSALAEADPE